MAFNVTEFSGVLNKRGVAKQSNFEMIVSFPPAMPLAAGGGPQELAFRCDSAEIPGRSIQTSTYKPYGNGLTHKVGYDVTYPEVTVSMICGKDLAERAVFSAWQSLVIGKHATNPNNLLYNQHLGYYDTYARGQVIINQYDEEGNVTASFTLKDAYPVIINSMPVSWASEEVHRVTVQFAYLHFVENSSPSMGNGPNIVNFSDVGSQIKNQVKGYLQDIAIGAISRGVNKVLGGLF